jgi:hypothetical protein
VDLDAARTNGRLTIVRERDLALKLGQFGGSFVHLIDKIHDRDPKAAKPHLVGKPETRMPHGFVERVPRAWRQVIAQ